MEQAAIAEITLRQRRREACIALIAPWSRSFVSTKHPRRQAWLPRVTQITVLGRPGNIIVVAGATELPFDDVRHRDRVTTGTHVES